MLMKAVEDYLSVRRAAGFEMNDPEYLLRSFARFASKKGEDFVSGETVICWASQAPSPTQRRNKLNTIIRFARHMRSEDKRHEIPQEGVFGPKPQRRIPFIFSRVQIHRLIQEAYRLGPAGSLRRRTPRSDRS